MLLSARILAAAGIATPAFELAAAASADAAAGALLTSSGLTLAEPSVSMIAMTSPAAQIVKVDGSDGAAVDLDDLGDDAGGRRRQLEDHLVGFDIDQVFVAGDRFADLLVPCQQGRFGDRLGQLWNLDFDLCHVLLRIFIFCGAPSRRGIHAYYLVRTKPLSFEKAVSNNSFCCALCLSA
jgi:hypothetical protein